MRDEWQRTASLEALLVNLHRDPRKRSPVSPSEFDPFRRRDAKHPRHTQPRPIPVDITVLRDVFCRTA